MDTEGQGGDGNRSSTGRKTPYHFKGGRNGVTRTQHCSKHRKCSLAFLEGWIETIHRSPHLKLHYPQSLTFLVARRLS